MDLPCSSLVPRRGSPDLSLRRSSSFAASPRLCTLLRPPLPHQTDHPSLHTQELRLRDLCPAHHGHPTPATPTPRLSTTSTHRTHVRLFILQDLIHMPPPPGSPPCSFWQEVSPLFSEPPFLGCDAEPSPEWHKRGVSSCLLNGAVSHFPDEETETQRVPRPGSPVT